MRQDYQRFSALSIAVIVAGPEKPEAFQKYWEKENLPFIGVPDPQRRLLALYGQEFALFKLGRMPAQFLIDMSGIVCFAHYGQSMMDIATNEQIFDRRQTPATTMNDR